MPNFIVDAIGGPLDGTQLGSFDLEIDAGNPSPQLEFDEGNAPDMGDQLARYVYRLTDSGTVGRAFPYPGPIGEPVGDKLSVTLNMYQLVEVILDEDTGDLLGRIKFLGNYTRYLKRDEPQNDAE